MKFPLETFPFDIKILPKYIIRSIPPLEIKSLINLDTLYFLLYLSTLLIRISYSNATLLYI